jgi:hypothetical protein
MAQDKPIIEPERAGLWAAAAFILALVAFVLAFAGIYRSNYLLATTQLEILALNKKVENLHNASGAPAMPAPASTAPTEQPAAK